MLRKLTSRLTIQSEGELVDLIEDFSEGRVQFAFVKVKDPNTTLPKYALIAWVSYKWWDWIWD